ncbi:MAG: signal recognition particle-docking protein FtsY [Ruminococcaceae bacterium]|nr:signal recognition particle-docking protein FtsY [Oscillospiraceae bacterium]
MGIFNRKISRGLRKTRDQFSGNINNVLDAFEEIGDELYDELTEVLIMGDVGVSTSAYIVDQVKERVGKKGIKYPKEVRTVIKEVVAEMLGEDQTIDFVTTPAIILVIGVNGVGKTTTIGKMANYFREEGKKVILGAADTFRAAAIDQLEIWAERAEVDIIKHKEGADPAAVVFDTINAGVSRNVDVIICDTAGRLHNKKHLMDELNKIYRVIDRELPYSDREIFLVLDATTGQNAISQAKEFMGVAEVSGIILTKLDGTARGGVVLSIKNDLKLPVKFIGVGEAIDDLQPFSATTFAESLFDVSPETDDTDPIITVNEERLAKDKAEAAERAAEAKRIEKEEAERLAKEETERIAKEEVEKLVKEETERIAKEKEATRIVEEERFVTEKVEKIVEEIEESVEKIEKIEEKEIEKEEGLSKKIEEIEIEELVEEKKEEPAKAPKKEKEKKKSFWSDIFGSGEYIG